MLNRVLELADRDNPCYAADAPEVFSLIPLQELLGELLGVGPAAKRVMAAYGRVIGRFGSELALLLDTSLEEIELVSPLLAEAVRRIRAGLVFRSAGYDGLYGTVRVFAQGEQSRLGLDEGLLKRG